MSIIKGAYIARLNLREEHNFGVAKKVKAQVNALSQPGIQVDLFYPSCNKIYKGAEVVYSFPSWLLMTKLNYYLLFYITLALTLRERKFIYIRYQRSGPLFLFMLACIRQTNPGVKLFLELPTYPYDMEQKTFRDHFHGGIDKIFRHFLAYFVDYVITFSRLPVIFGIPTIQTDNGVDVTSTSQLPAPNIDPPIRFLGLANLSFWNGYDRVIRGIALYQASDAKRRVIFDIVGSGSDLPSLKREVEALGLESVVCFHGPLTGEALTRVMTGCHLGVSTLGMHRLNKSTTDLKSREFCARGLPFVIGYADPDFPIDLPFVFRVPGNDEPLDITEAVKFYDCLRHEYPDFQLKMWVYANKNLDWKVKLSEVNRRILN